MDLPRLCVQTWLLVGISLSGEASEEESSVEVKGVNGG